MGDASEAVLIAAVGDGPLCIGRTEGDKAMRRAKDDGLRAVRVRSIEDAAEIGREHKTVPCGVILLCAVGCRDEAASDESLREVFGAAIVEMSDGGLDVTFANVHGYAGALRTGAAKIQ